MVILETILFGSALGWYRSSKKLKKVRHKQTLASEQLDAVHHQIERLSIVRQNQEYGNKLAIESLRRSTLENRIAFQDTERSTLENRIASQDTERSTLERRMRQADERTEQLQRELNELKRQMSRMIFSSPAAGARSSRPAPWTEKESARPKATKVEKKTVKPKERTEDRETGIRMEKEEPREGKTLLERLMEAKRASGAASSQKRPSRGVPIGGGQRRPKHRPPVRMEPGSSNRT
jgi:hypothetical protein